MRRFLGPLFLFLLILLNGTACSKIAGLTPKEIANQVVATLPEMTDQGAVYLVFRSQGKPLGEIWQEGENWKFAIEKGIRKVAAEIPKERLQTVDSIEFCLTHSRRQVDPKKNPEILANIHRGIRGIDLFTQASRRRLCPTEMIAKNLDFKEILEAFNDSYGKPEVTVFDAEQILVELKPFLSIERMFRGNQVIPLPFVVREEVEKLAQRLSTWMMTNLRKTGQMTYLYYPGRGEAEGRNNMIRQFMATLCLVRMARFYDSPEALNAAKINLQYNLKEFYQEEGDLGFILYKDKAKLGAAALAALAIIESPFRNEFSEQEEKLVSLVQYLWQKDGSFRTFYKPADRNDVQNFYPGEALLMLTTLYQENPEPAFQAQLLRSIRYYYNWHLANRNPAFIPWHSQAYFRLYQKSKTPELAQKMFTLNDWLLDMQEWRNAPYMDAAGRFHNPKHPEFGPPHASSTGVYMEGLADALRMALLVDDKERAHRYKSSIRQGVRSLMQLEFADDIDLFYVPQRQRVRGGVRTTIYDNSIRVDNVQHNLMALLTILKTPEFWQ